MPVDTKNEDIIKKYFDLVQDEIKHLISEDKEIKQNQIETFNNEIFNQTDEIKNQIKNFVDRAATNNLDIKRIAKSLYDKFKIQVKNNVFNQTDPANIPNKLMGEKTMNFDDFSKINEIKIGKSTLPDILFKPPIKIGEAKYTLSIVQSAFNAGQKSILDMPSVIKVLNTDSKFVANFSKNIPQFNDWWNKRNNKI
jgi:hypothetical protein